jgi:predicted peptidase
MGAYGAWYWSTMYPNRFAAVVPICGGGNPAHGFPDRVCALKNVPVWAFHGANDDIVPLSETQMLVETLKECGGNVRLTVYPDSGHDSWTETYNNPELYDWLTAQKRPSPIPSESSATS